MQFKVKYLARSYSETRYLCGTNTYATRRTFLGSKVESVTFQSLESAERFIERAVAGHMYHNIPIRWGAEETRPPIKQDYTIEISY